MSVAVDNLSVGTPSIGFPEYELFMSQPQLIDHYRRRYEENEIYKQ
ncbi:hypothetical protein [Staphylococcus marylandisciuri]|nr:hypothetical protein [Staphylococcus marylandisciuri]